MTVLGTGGDTLAYSVVNDSTANSLSGTVTSSAAATPTVNFSAVAGTFTLGKTTQALVNGTTASDTFTVTEGATGTVAIASGATNFKTVTLAATVQSLALAGLAGDDTFIVNQVAGGLGRAAGKHRWRRSQCQ